MTEGIEMKTIIHTGEIEQLNKGDSGNPVYLLGENGRFYNTEYKIMDGQPDLLSCYRGTLNGQTELVYLTEGLVSLNAALPEMDENTLLEISVNICKAIKAITSNGFLNWQHIDLSADRIYVQPSDKSVHLVYLPVEGIYITPGYLEKDVTEFISSLTKDTKEPDSQKMAALRNYAAFFKGTINEFSDYMEKLKRSKIALFQNETSGKLVLYDDQNDCRIVVDKPRYSIGKRVAAVDGVISYSKFVGRVHCQIVNKDGNYYVYDLDSKNGTFVNGKAVAPEEGVLLKDGDQLKLANVRFTVSFEED